MHELSIVLEVAKNVKKIAKEQNLKKVDTIVLQVGALSSVIPKYLENCYPAAVDGTMLENTKLKIEILPANALCHDCNKVYNARKYLEKCPYCGGNKVELLCGREFILKEIIAC